MHVHKIDPRAYALPLPLAHMNTRARTLALAHAHLCTQPHRQICFCLYTTALMCTYTRMFMYTPSCEYKLMYVRTQSHRHLCTYTNTHELQGRTLIRRFMHTYSRYHIHERSLAHAPALGLELIRTHTPMHIHACTLYAQTHA